MGTVIPASKLATKRLERAQTKLKVAKAKVTSKKAARTLRDALAEDKKQKRLPKKVNSESDQRLVLNRQLRKLLRMTKRLEEAFEVDNDRRVVYQVVQLYQKVNETLAALRDLKSSEEKHHLLEHRLLRPTFRQFAHLLTDLVVGLRKVAVHRAPAKLKNKVGRQFDDLVLQRSNVIQELYDTTLERTLNIVKEDL